MEDDSISENVSSDHQIKSNHITAIIVPYQKKTPRNFDVSGGVLMIR
jgi:hypothetical protein